MFWWSVYMQRYFTVCSMPCMALLHCTSLSVVMDYIIYGSRTAQVTYIISEHQEAITAKLLEMDRGVTLLDGEGAYNGNKRKVILCAMKRSQIVPVKLMVREIDPDAFVIVCKANEVLGEGFGEYTRTVSETARGTNKRSVFF